jgi:hypothetical protein
VFLDRVPTRIFCVFSQQYKALLEKANYLMAKFTKSPKATARLLELQREAGVLVPRRAHVAGGVRWWRWEDLLEAMAVLSQFVNDALSDDSDVLLPDSDVWTYSDKRLASQLLPQLQTVHELCRPLEAEKSPTINLVLPAIAKLHKDLSDSKDRKESKDTPFAKRFLSHLDANAEVRSVSATAHAYSLCYYQIDPLLVAKTILDPRFRSGTLSSIPAGMVGSAKGVLRDRLAKYEIQEEKAAAKLQPPAATPSGGAGSGSSSSSGSGSSSASTATSLFCDLVDKPKAAVIAGSADLELALYFSMEFDASTIPDPLAWWAQQTTLPKMQRLVRELWAEQASSASVERLFSACGNIETDKRTRTETATLERLAVCHGNPDVLDLVLALPKWEAVCRQRAAGAAVAVAPDAPSLLMAPSEDHLAELKAEFAKLDPRAEFKVIRGHAASAVQAARAALATAGPPAGPLAADVAIAMEDSSSDDEEEPQPKRPKTGVGGLKGFFQPVAKGKGKEAKPEDASAAAGAGSGSGSRG